MSHITPFYVNTANTKILKNENVKPWIGFGWIGVDASDIFTNTLSRLCMIRVESDLLKGISVYQSVRKQSAVGR